MKYRNFMARHMLQNRNMKGHALPDRKERFQRRHDDDWKEEIDCYKNSEPGVSWNAAYSRDSEDDFD